MEHFGLHFQREVEPYFLNDTKIHIHFPPTFQFSNVLKEIDVLPSISDENYPF